MLTDRAALRSLGLLPTGLVSLVRASSPARLGHGVLTVGLGVVAWFLTGLMVLGAVRGPFYGFVDPGPYDHSWGGPSLAGAWTVHALVWVALVPAWLALIWGVERLHGALGRGSWWARVATLLVLAGAALLVRAWVHQL